MLKWLLEHQRQRTLGILMGLLCGAVFGLYPFQHGIAPQVGDTIKGQVLTEVTLPDVEREDWATAYFQPSGRHLGGALLLIGLGLGVTEGIRRLGNTEPQE